MGSTLPNWSRASTTTGEADAKSAPAIAEVTGSPAGRELQLRGRAGRHIESSGRAGDRNDHAGQLRARAKIGGLKRIPDPSLIDRQAIEGGRAVRERHMGLVPFKTPSPGGLLRMVSCDGVIERRVDHAVRIFGGDASNRMSTPA